MSKILATHGKIFTSRADLVVLPLPADGVPVSPTINHLLGLYPKFKHDYQEAAHKGELALGDVSLEKIQKEVSGLGANNNKGFNYIAYLISQKHSNQPHKMLAIAQACKALSPQFYELLRQKSLRHVAILATPIATNPSNKEDIETLWQIFCETLVVPNLRIDVHFGDNVKIDELCCS